MPGYRSRRRGSSLADGKTWRARCGTAETVGAARWLRQRAMIPDHRESYRGHASDEAGSQGGFRNVRVAFGNRDRLIRRSSEDKTADGSGPPDFGIRQDEGHRDQCHDDAPASRRLGDVPESDACSDRETPGRNLVTVGDIGHARQSWLRADLQSSLFTPLVSMCFPCGMRGIFPCRVGRDP